MSEEKKDIPGVLSIIELNMKEREVFLDYMNIMKPYMNADFLFATFGDRALLKFFDVFAGVNIKVPSREETKKIINYIKIYQYCKDRGFTEDGYEKASKIFGRRLMSVKRVVAKVERVLSGQVDDEEE